MGWCAWLLNLGWDSLLAAVGHVLSDLKFTICFFDKCALNVINHIFFLYWQPLTSKIKPLLASNIFIFWDPADLSPTEILAAWSIFFWSLFEEVYRSPLEMDTFFFDVDYPALMVLSYWFSSKYTIFLFFIWKISNSMLNRISQ